MSAIRGAAQQPPGTGSSRGFSAATTPTSPRIHWTSTITALLTLCATVSVHRPHPDKKEYQCSYKHHTAHRNDIACDPVKAHNTRKNKATDQDQATPKEDHRHRLPVIPLLQFHRRSPEELKTRLKPHITHMQFITLEVHMGRDKARDDKLFNCSESHEVGYVAGLYPDNKKLVEGYLIQLCIAGVIKNFTHAQVYDIIEDRLKLPVPVENPTG
jgi:hypothetical protein